MEEKGKRLSKSSETLVGRVVLVQWVYIVGSFLEAGVNVKNTFLVSSLCLRPGMSCVSR